MSVGLILLIILVLLALGAFPRAGSYSGSWGYGPFGGIGLVLIIILILVLTGHI